MPQTGQGWGQVLHQMLTTLTPATLFLSEKICLKLGLYLLMKKGKKRFWKDKQKVRLALLLTCGSPTPHHGYYFMVQCLCTRQ